jgi:hypothetical protein
MKIRKRYLVMVIPLVLLCALVLTNPSQSQHAKRFADELGRLEAEHIATCPKCAGTKLSAGPNADDTLSILGEQGTYYQSLFILSYVSDGGLIRAKTIGIGGFVFGPVLKRPLSCPIDFLVMPIPSPIKHEFHVTIRSDDTLHVDGQQISEAALLKRLGELPDKSETEVWLHAGPTVQFIRVHDLLDQIGSLGFQVGMKTIPEDE